MWTKNIRQVITTLLSYAVEKCHEARLLGLSLAKPGLGVCVFVDKRVSGAEGS